MRRREFIQHGAYRAGAAWLASQVLAKQILSAPLSTKFSANDTVAIGKTGIKTSRLAMGTGTVGSGHHSHQTALGVDGLSALLLNGYEHGLRFFDAADSYGSHPHVAEALKHVPRDKVTVLTKTWARDPATARADLGRFRKELGTDGIDICLMHCLTEADWTERYRGVMDVFSEAKEKGVIRAHGCSCHNNRRFADCGEIPVGRSRFGTHESRRRVHGCRSADGSRGRERDEGLRQRHHRNENPRSRADARSAG